VFLQNEEMHFDFNISNCKHSNKITINNQTFNVVYIDGCHEPDFIKRDMERSFHGIMWMDDYHGGWYKNQKYNENFFKRI